jgi:hypothetical protein
MSGEPREQISEQELCEVFIAALRRGGRLETPATAVAVPAEERSWSEGSEIAG